MAQSEATALHYSGRWRLYTEKNNPTAELCSLGQKYPVVSVS